ncbi:MAG: J domain-containing protein [Candidatus Latescibacteria bacterium]|nr:J domain-containing protein [Candidatus Latescibacterota bacterium]
MNPLPPDPYAALGLDPRASAEEIKQAYFAQVRAHPPERDPEAFKQIRAAYEQLRTPQKRFETDMLRLAPWPAPALSPPPPLELRVAPADLIRAARALTDLARSDWREDCREVRL